MSRNETSRLAKGKSDIPAKAKKDRQVVNIGHSLRENLSECDRQRRSAVDQEILRYLGALAKKDDDGEGFAFPSINRVAKQIQRTPFYVGQRIKYLQRIGRLVPVKRERFGRLVNGWIVVRYTTWANSQGICLNSSEKNGRPPQSSENNLGSHSNNLPEHANSLEEKRSSDDANPLKIEADSAIGGAQRSGLDLSCVHQSDGRSPSQFTGHATTTALDQLSKSSTKKEHSKAKKTLEDRLVEKISREGEHLSFYRDNEGVEAYEEFLEKIRTASKFLAFPFDENDPAVSFDFCAIFCEKFERFNPRLQTGEMKASTFCTKVIDECERDKYALWPPSFTEHRNRLRRAERAEQIQFWVKKDSNGFKRRIGLCEESLDWS
jgi:hypothetical protein